MTSSLKAVSMAGLVPSGSDPNSGGRCGGLPGLPIGLGLAFLALFLADPRPTSAQDCSDENCAVETARALMSSGNDAEAVGFLERMNERFPGNEMLQLLGGIAYHRTGEFLWAIDALERLSEVRPGDCEISIWLSWSYFQLSLVDAALDTLHDSGCPDAGPMAARLAMLQSLLAHSRGDGRHARSLLDVAFSQDKVYEAERDALPRIADLIAPDRIRSLSWSLETMGGYTSNAFLGSPSDPESPGHLDADSALWQVDLWTSVIPDLGIVVRPAIELQVRMLRFLSDAASGLSTLDLSGRAGLVIDWEGGRILIGYRPDYLLLDESPDGTRGPVWYFAGHRAEVEVQATRWLLVFAGAGRRSFWELGRTRTELDGGMGGGLALPGPLDLLWAVTGRQYWSANEAYDLSGAGALANLGYRFEGGWRAALALTLGADWYPRSADFFDMDERRDLFVRVGPNLVTPSLAGLRLSLGYQYSWRDSTADSYKAEDHRVLLRLTWSGDRELQGPGVSEEEPLVRFDWGGVGDETGPSERIRDLLRQEEQVNRSCGCSE